MPEKLKFRAMRVWGTKKLGRPIIAKTELSGRQKPLSPPSTKTFLGNGAEADVIYECRADNRNATRAISAFSSRARNITLSVIMDNGRAISAAAWHSPISFKAGC